MGLAYDKTGVELLPRLQDKISGTRGGELFDKLAQDHVYLSSGDTSFDRVPVLSWVRVTQQVIPSVYNRDLLFLKLDFNVGKRHIGDRRYTGYSSLISPESSTPTAPPPTMIISSAASNLSRHCDATLRRPASLSGRSMGPDHFDPVARTRAGVTNLVLE